MVERKKKKTALISVAGFFIFIFFTPLHQGDSLRGEEDVYTYGAKFEPPEGRIFHGMGQWPEDNLAYLDMLEDRKLFPLTELCFFDIEPTRPWSMVLDRIRTYLDDQRWEGRIPNLNLGMSGPDKEGIEWWKYDPPYYFGVDDEVASTAQYDQRIEDIADLLQKQGTPVFMRIGGEFNGLWNGHHPYDYPRAFRKIVQIFRNKSVNNVAFVWCYEPSAADDFDETNSQGVYKWFPGDDVIDWYSIDVFGRKDFSHVYPEYDRGVITNKGKTERFLLMAFTHGKPVMIAESSVVDYDITSALVWWEWFFPYFKFISDHPQVKGFVYVNAEWPRYRPGDPFGWMDGRIHINPELSQQYVYELKKDKYLHVGGASLLKDFQAYFSIPRHPLNFSGYRIQNRSLSQIEYLNVLTWEANPKNPDITSYRIYQITEGGKILLDEVNAQTFHFLHRNVEKNGRYEYGIAAVNSQNQEGNASFWVLDANQ